MSQLEQLALATSSFEIRLDLNKPSPLRLLALRRVTVILVSGLCSAHESLYNRTFSVAQAGPQQFCMIKKCKIEVSLEEMAF